MKSKTSQSQVFLSGRLNKQQLYDNDYFTMSRCYFRPHAHFHATKNGSSTFSLISLQYTESTASALLYIQVQVLVQVLVL